MPAAARLAVRAYHTETAYRLAELIVRLRMLHRIVGDDVDAALELAREINGGAEAADAEYNEMPEDERVELIDAVRARVTPDTLDGFPVEPAAVLATVLYMTERHVGDDSKRGDG